MSFAEETIKASNEGVNVISPSEPDVFDTETAEKRLAIDKKVRKKLAKTKHPAKAIADEAAALEKKKQSTKGE